MNVTICEGDSYRFFGKSLKHPGHYVYLHECISHELDLTVAPLPTLHCCKDTLVEYGKAFQLKVSGADTYLWSTGDTTTTITIVPLKDNSYSVTGYTQHGCHTTANVKVRTTLIDDDLVLFPNPANDKVKIHMPLIDKVEVLNLFGDTIEQVNANRDVVELDVSHYLDGVYIVHVQQLSKHNYKKLIVRH